MSDRPAQPDGSRTAWRTLLVPHDFSPCAGRALQLAAGLARTHGARLVLVHVSALPADLDASALITPAGAEAPVRIDAYATRGALQRLEAIAAPLRVEGLSVATVAKVGNVVDEVLAAADEVGADALVLGTHGRQGLAHFFVGSVTERVVRRATVPVVTVRAPAPRAELTAEERAAEDELTG